MNPTRLLALLGIATTTLGLAACASAPAPCAASDAATTNASAASAPPPPASPSAPKPLLTGTYDVVDFVVDGKNVDFARGFFGDEVTTCPAGDLRLEFSGSTVTVRLRFACWVAGAPGEKKLKVRECSVDTDGLAAWTADGFSLTSKVDLRSTVHTDIERSKGETERTSDNSTCSASLPTHPFKIVKNDAASGDVLLEGEHASWHLVHHDAPIEPTRVIDDAIRILRARTR